MRQTLYDTLGVPRDADPEAVRAAYRRLARELHPDMNPGDADAEERFKEVSQAYGVLSNPQRRGLYDEFGEVSLDSGFDAESARRAHAGFGPRFYAQGSGQDVPLEDLDDFFGGLFSRSTRTRSRRGPDLTAHITLDFVSAARGGAESVTIGRPEQAGGVARERLTVQIPPGVSDGGRIRLRGKGGAGPEGQDGDLYLHVQVRPHPVFSREGRDIHLDLPVTVREAALGAKIELPTLTGRATVSVPAGSQSGRKLRLRGKGIPAAGGTSAGDLIAAVQIRVPEGLDEAGRAAIEALAPFESSDLRRSLFR